MTTKTNNIEVIWQLQASDLRIGNYLRLVGESWTKQRDTIRPITAQDILDIEGGADGYEAVELTPDILEKCGFVMVHERIDNDGIKALPADWIKGRFVLNAGHHSWWYWDSPVNTRINTVHHFQNLYHALTGEELKLKS